MDSVEFDKIEKFVLAQISQIFSDIFESTQILNNNSRLIKSQLCLVLTAADSFSRFYIVLTDENYDINNEKSNNETRFRGWLDRFVLNNGNKIYMENRDKISCDSKTIWDTRNSLIHSYCFPRKRNINFGFPQMEKNEWEKFKKYCREKTGECIRVIDPDVLKQAIFQGFVEQRDTLVDMIKNNPPKYIKGILKLNEIFKKEGTIYVEYKN